MLWAYVAQQTGYMASEGLLYAGLNTASAVLLLLSYIEYLNWGGLVINVVWGGVGIYKIVGILKQ